MYINKNKNLWLIFRREKGGAKKRKEERMRGRVGGVGGGGGGGFVKTNLTLVTNVSSAGNSRQF